MLGRVWLTEIRKLTRSAVWIPVALTLAFTLFIGLLANSDSTNLSSSADTWLEVYRSIAYPYAILLFPLETCAIAALVCRMEHQNGGWKMIHALPVPRITVYVTKLSIVLGLLFVSQVLLFAGILTDGFLFLHLHNPVPWFLIIKGLIGSLLAAIPIAALQFWVATAWESFGAQFAIATILTIPATAAVFVVGSLWYFIRRDIV